MTLHGYLCEQKWYPKEKKKKKIRKKSRKKERIKKKKKRMNEHQQRQTKLCSCIFGAIFLLLLGLVFTSTEDLEMFAWVYVCPCLLLSSCWKTYQVLEIYLTFKSHLQLKDLNKASQICSPLYPRISTWHIKAGVSVTLQYGSHHTTLQFPSYTFTLIPWYTFFKVIHPLPKLFGE